MFLRRLEISNFRKIRHLVIDDLKDGINVLSGDNEAGKSTILAALRAALFERHRVTGDAATAMLPYNQSVRPEVSLDFDLNGNFWKLRKAFCQKQEVELIGAGERHTGDPAEERLAQLFGFTPPGRGGSKPQDHQGIYGLLWVEQGVSHRELGIGAGRDSIASALESEVGQVIGGERGRALLVAAETRKNLFWDKRGKPRGELKTLADEVEALAARKADLELRLAAYDEKIKLLFKKREILSRHDRDATLEKATASLVECQRNFTLTKQLEANAIEASEKRKLSEARARVIADRLETRQSLIRQIEVATIALGTVTTAANELKASFSGLENVDKTANERLAQARADKLKADQSVAEIEQAINHRRAHEVLTRLEQQLTDADMADSLRRMALATAESIKLDQKQISKLEKAVAECSKVEARIEAASVRILLEPAAAGMVSIDGKVCDPKSPLLLSNDTTLELEGYGRLVVHPGGGIDSLVQSLRDAQHVLQRSLQELGIASVEDAKAQVQRKTEAANEAELQKKLIAASAAKGLDALRQEVETQRTRVQRLASHNLSPADSTEEALELARKYQNLESKQEAAAQEDSSRAKAARDAANIELAVQTERVAAATRDLAAKRRELEEACQAVADDELLASHGAALTKLQNAQTVESQAATALEHSNPEAVTIALQMAKEAEETIRTDIEATAKEAREIEIELKALGRDGLGEQLSEVQGEFTLKQRQYHAMAAEAGGSRLLYETLARAQRESKDRWLGPVRDRVQPYLKLIQPESDIILNEDTLEIEQFVRGGVEEPFNGLSIGAREQAAVIARLALADVLRASGQPSIVILDDALVNTDEERLKRMHLVLRKAAANLQILILTCRERDFTQLGARVRRV
ncbi:AAA family ATPase [Microvirga brassicacearum]|uniref:DUF2813 domain-containing protein n=1 Tax=Microvirga brassicacearum TaxID=2580413 RepID=A0A5N3PBY2_9HYPH|nr:AAA family ATPase [Microvirga brassicacearum]KAB0267258.1 DUF2813 domain-containing protein [Microvirga brassicacearum]